jgi:hypothetical protein
MISIVKGKTEIPHNPTDALRRFFHLPAVVCRSFLSFARFTDQATRHPCAVSGAFPLHGRLSLGQPDVLETTLMSCSLSPAHVVQLSARHAGKIGIKQLYVTAVKQPVAVARSRCIPSEHVGPL